MPDVPDEAPVTSDGDASDGSAATPSAPAEADAEVEESGIPTQCAKRSEGGEICLPSKKFARGMCDGDYPTVALHMFAAGTPWTRLYLTRETKAWNASGGGSSNEKLAFDEEVIVLRHRAPNAGGVQIEGMGASFDVVRWNGACVTLSAGEVTRRAPRKPKNARIVWKRLERKIRDVLKRDEGLRPHYLNHRKSCKGVSMGVVSKSCVKFDAVLSDAVATYARNGGQIPAPTKLP